MKNVIIEVVYVRDKGSCNFCQRGKIDETGRMIYPYSQAYNIAGKNNSLSVIMCLECLKELQNVHITEQPPGESGCAAE